MKRNTWQASRSFATSSRRANCRSLVSTGLSWVKAQIKCQVIIRCVIKIYFIALICIKIRLSITILFNVIFAVMPTSHKPVLNYGRCKLVLNSFQPIKKSLGFGQMLHSLRGNYRTSRCANFSLIFNNIWTHAESPLNSLAIFQLLPVCSIDERLGMLFRHFSNARSHTILTLIKLLICDSRLLMYLIVIILNLDKRLRKWGQMRVDFCLLGSARIPLLRNSGRTVSTNLQHSYYKQTNASIRCCEDEPPFHYGDCAIIWESLRKWHTEFSFQIRNSSSNNEFNEPLINN